MLSVSESTDPVLEDLTVCDCVALLLESALPLSSAGAAEEEGDEGAAAAGPGREGAGTDDE